MREKLLHSRPHNSVQARVPRSHTVRGHYMPAGLCLVCAGIAGCRGHTCADGRWSSCDRHKLITSKTSGRSSTFSRLLGFWPVVTFLKICAAFSHSQYGKSRVATCARSKRRIGL